MIEVSVDLPDLKDIEKQLGKYGKYAPDALRNAINATMYPLNRHIAKLAAEHYTYKPKGLQDAKKIRATRNKLEGAILFGGSPIPLDRFEYKTGSHGQRKFYGGGRHFGGLMTETPGAQLMVKVRKDSPFKPVAHAFEVNLHGKKIFQRETGKGLSHKIAARLTAAGIRPTSFNSVPVKRMFSTDVARMVENKVVADEWREFAQNTLNEQVNRSVAKMIQKMSNA